MLLKELKLKHYTRLYIPNIKYIDYIPKQNIQIILASNGSGKSSLLKEVIPNVENLKKEYDEDGYRYAVYNHRDKLYELNYDRNSNRYSFKLNGEELNQAGIKKTQKILIEEHFKINKYIHEMLLSTTTFTNMSTTERKRWFTDILTSIDYKYALDKYNKTKTHIRDLISYIKLLQSKIMFDDQNLKVMNDTYIAKLKQDKSEFVKLLDNILAKRPLIKDEKNIDMSMILSIQNELYRLINKYKDKPNESLVKNIDSIILSKEFELSSINKRIDEVKDKLKKLGTEGLDIKEDKKELEVKLNELKSKLDKYVENSNLIYDDYKLYIEELLSKHSDLIDISSKLLELDKIDITTDYVNKLTETMNKKKNELDRLEQVISDIDKELQKQIAYSEAEDVTCPRCKNIFKPNYEEQKLRVLKSELAKKLELKETLEKSYKELLEIKEKVIEKRQLVAMLKMSLATDRLKHIFKDLLDSSDKFFNTHIISRKISDLYAKLPDYDVIINLIKEYKDIKQKLTIIESITIDKLSYLQNLKKELESELSRLLQKSLDITKELNTYKSIKSDKAKMNKYMADLKRFLNRIKELKKDKYDSLLRDYYNELIYLIKHEIADIDSKLIKYDKIKTHREELVKELDEYKSELELSKKLEEYLSPTKGIIGESISKTINIILERMNEIINSIWTYEIKILPCNIEDNDLTFRFPVLLNNNKEIPDVNKGSSAIKEIIDFAFKITAMEFLDMIDYPLILDESFSTFDAVHRIRAYEYIEELSRERFKQIFLISHYMESYGRYNNADVIILDNSNVNYTGEYNSVIDIKYK